MAMYAVMSGLKPSISAFVTQKQPKTMEELLEVARLAELTAGPPVIDDLTLAKSLAGVEGRIDEKLSAINEFIKKATMAQVRTRSPTPDARRVSFEDQPCS